MTVATVSTVSHVNAKMMVAFDPELLDEVTIPGAPHNPYQQIAARYVYDADKTKCPACGGTGIPWRAYFSCEDCYCVALVYTGHAFVPCEMPKEGT